MSNRTFAEEQKPHKLTVGEKHILQLIRRDAGPDGWTPVSKAVAPLFTDKKIPCGTIPEALCEFERIGTEGAGRARLTQKGIDVLDAIAWLL